MNIDITCQEATEYISAEVDGQLEKVQKEQLQRHLGACELCRLEMSLEKKTKQTIQLLKSTPVPAEVRERVLDQIGAFPGDTAEAPFRFLDLFRLPGLRMSLALGGTLAVGIVLWMVVIGKKHHSHSKPVDGSVITETLNNFDELLTGQLTPAIQSNDPKVVKSYLQEKAKFHVEVPEMPQFKLVGARYTASDEGTIAHLIYKSGDDYIYVTQTDLRNIIGGSKRYIPTDALVKIQASGWYFEGNISDCTLAMWLNDSTLCTAVGDMNKEVLLANIAGAAR